MNVILVVLLLLLSRASSFSQNGSMCPLNSSNYIPKCFTYFNQKLNWAQAQDTCQQRGLQFITIQNLNDISAIAALAKKYQLSENIWIRLEKHTEKIQHRPGNGQQESLKDHQKVAIEKEFCVELIASEEFLKWNNTGCQESKPFLCQSLPLHSEKGNKVTKLSKVTESNEINKDCKLTKCNAGIKEKFTTTEDKKIKESLFTNNNSSEKGFIPFLVVVLVFFPFIITFFPQIKSTK
ncbi:snaclec bothroinsularin subunit alpha-like isoform X2 [Elephas maximus indicus]|nr:snaclec bothroinsularin subunit alpha-like isoform X2 [Elephas maximus indicus]